MEEFKEHSSEETAAVLPEDAAETREKRIAELREQCSKGAYRVDAAKVSAKIVERHLDEPTS